MTRWLVSVVVCLAFSVPIAACGSSSKPAAAPSATVDASTVESQIKQQLSSSGAEVTKAKCPSDVQSEKGATFKCSVTWSNGATGKVKVTETSRNQFTCSVVSGSVQIPGATVDKSLEQSLAKQGAPNATVNCPENIIVKVDSTVTCDVSGAGGQASGTVSFTFSSAEGTVDSSSVTTG